MLSILAVDDSASMRQMVAFTLKSAGYSVVEAVDGQDAYEKASKKDFDLVLNISGVAAIRLRHPAERSGQNGRMPTNHTGNRQISLP